jgi:anti-anti-sigma regulatory factor
MSTLRLNGWTLKIEKDSHDGITTIRLIGHFQSEHVEELKSQIRKNGPNFVLDLKEVTVVDVEIVRLLEIFESDGIKIVHCSPYIREWMVRERRS